jgi:hypothetical protein
VSACGILCLRSRSSRGFPLSILSTDARHPISHSRDRPVGAEPSEGLRRQAKALGPRPLSISTLHLANVPAAQYLAFYLPLCPAPLCLCLSLCLATSSLFPCALPLEQPRRTCFGNVGLGSDLARISLVSRLGVVIRYSGAKSKCPPRATRKSLPRLVSALVESVTLLIQQSSFAFEPSLVFGRRELC